MLALECIDLVKTYSNGFLALNNINLKIEQGDFFALLGINGAGKSTLLGIISSLIKKTSGQLKILGIDVEKEPYAVKKQIGVVPQEFNFNQFLTPENVLLTNAGFYGIDEKSAKGYSDWLLQNLNIYEKRHTQIRNLSGGMKRRVMIARALVHHPKLLLLDEPTVGVDIELRHSMWNFLHSINKNGTSIILTTHYLEEAEELCNKIAIIDKGELVLQGNKEDLLSKTRSRTIILTSVVPIKQLPEFANYQYKILDDFNVEITLDETENLNDLFNALDNADIKVQNIHNKNSRLEELFLQLTQSNPNILLAQQ